MTTNNIKSGGWFVSQLQSEGNLNFHFLACKDMLSQKWKLINVLFTVFNCYLSVIKYKLNLNWILGSFEVPCYDLVKKQVIYYFLPGVTMEDDILNESKLDCTVRRQEVALFTIGKRTTTVCQSRHKNKCILAKQVFETKQEWNSNINNSVLVKENKEVNF